MFWSGSADTLVRRKTWQLVTPKRVLSGDLCGMRYTRANCQARIQRFGVKVVLKSLRVGLKHANNQNHSLKHSFSDRSTQRSFRHGALKSFPFTVQSRGFSALSESVKIFEFLTDVLFPLYLWKVCFSKSCSKHLVPLERSCIDWFSKDKHCTCCMAVPLFYSMMVRCFFIHGCWEQVFTWVSAYKAKRLWTSDHHIHVFHVDHFI